MQLYYNKDPKFIKLKGLQGLQWCSADNRYIVFLPEKRVTSKTPEFCVFDALNKIKWVKIGTSNSVLEAERLIDEDIIKREEDRIGSKAW